MEKWTTTHNPGTEKQGGIGKSGGYHWQRGEDFEGFVT